MVEASVEEDASAEESAETTDSAAASAEGDSETAPTRNGVDRGGSDADDKEEEEEEEEQEVARDEEDAEATGQSRTKWPGWSQRKQVFLAVFVMSDSVWS